MATIEEYTNDELQQSLRQYGLNVPVTPTTRKVCENKLKKFMTQAGDGAFQQTTIPDNDSTDNFSRSRGYEEDRESTPQLPEESVITRRNLPSAQRQRDYKELSRHNHSEPDQSDEDPGETSVRELSPEEQRLFYKPKAREQSNGNIWKYVGLALLLIIFLAFLVFLNRNAQNIGDEI